MQQRALTRMNSVKEEKVWYRMNAGRFVMVSSRNQWLMAMTCTTDDRTETDGVFEIELMGLPKKHCALWQLMVHNAMWGRLNAGRSLGMGSGLWTSYLSEKRNKDSIQPQVSLRLPWNESKREVLSFRQVWSWLAQPIIPLIRCSAVSKKVKKQS